MENNNECPRGGEHEWIGVVDPSSHSPLLMTCSKCGTTIEEIDKEIKSNHE